jgi:hypothetical protein
MSFRKQYNPDQIIKAAATNTSIAGFLRDLGLQPKGQNYNTAKDLIDRHKLDISHWTGQAWARGKRLKQEGGYARPAQIKKHLIEDRGHCCESCGLSEWLNKPITLELDHIDGDRTNNLYSNLQLLCPNCHSQTPTWRRQKKTVGAGGGT